MKYWSLPAIGTPVALVLGAAALTAPLPKVAPRYIEPLLGMVPAQGSATTNTFR